MEEKYRLLRDVAFGMVTDRWIETIKRLETYEKAGVIQVTIQALFTLEELSILKEQLNVEAKTDERELRTCQSLCRLVDCLIEILSIPDPE